MDYYLPGEDRVSVSFDPGHSDFEILEISSSMERIVGSKEDTTWAIGVGGSIFAAPLIHDGVIYIGACDKNFYALDLETGRKRWVFHTDGPILSTATIEDGIIYFGSYDGNIYALTKEGNLAWRFGVGDKIYSDPCVWEGRVLFGSHDSNAYALDSKTGRLLWRFKTGAPVSSSAMVHDGVLYIGSNDSNLYAIDARSGRLRWKYPTNGPVRYRIVEWKGKLIFGSLDGCMRAVDMNGNLLWRIQTGDGIGTYPLLFGDTLYFGSRDMNWYAIDNDGRALWKSSCRSYPNELVVLGDSVYTCCCENGIYMLDRKTGKEMRVFPTNGWVIRLIEHQGKIYFGSWDCNVYSMMANGRVKWKFHTSLSFQSPLVQEEEPVIESFNVTWSTGKETKEKKRREDFSPMDYSMGFKSDYASAMSTNYLGSSPDAPHGKKKHHYA